METKECWDMGLPTHVRRIGAVAGAAASEALLTTDKAGTLSALLGRADMRRGLSLSEENSSNAKSLPLSIPEAWISAGYVWRGGIVERPGDGHSVVAIELIGRCRMGGIFESVQPRNDR